MSFFLFERRISVLHGNDAHQIKIGMRRRQNTTKKQKKTELNKDIKTRKADRGSEVSEAASPHMESIQLGRENPS